MVRFALFLGCAFGVAVRAETECDGGECDADLSSLLAIKVQRVSDRPGGHGARGIPVGAQLVKGEAAFCAHHGALPEEAGSLAEEAVAAGSAPETALGCHRDHGCIPEPPDAVHWDCRSQQCIVPDEWTCERGTEDDCRAVGAFWTGRRCCFDMTQECAAGLARDCEGRDMKWTGRKCCVPNDRKKVHATAGTKTKCNENGGRWSGTYCFVDAPRTQCNIGVEEDCAAASGIFTGFMCCVDEKWNCGAGSGNSCTGRHQVWTGFLCCQRGPRQCVAGMKRECEAGYHGGGIPGQAPALVETAKGGLAGPPGPADRPIAPIITWTGSKCCVPDDWTCTAGSINGCTGPHKFWTGTKCCVEGRSTCTAGHETACDEVHGIWTGSRCCLEGVKTCTAGTRNGCQGMPEQWTGGRCCVEGLQYCKASTEHNCHGPAATFTGTQCCVPQYWECEHRGSGECGPHESTVGCKCCREPEDY